MWKVLFLLAIRQLALMTLKMLWYEISVYPQITDDVTFFTYGLTVLRIRMQLS